VIRNCSACLSSLGNGVGVYGGEGNTVQDCVFTDMPFGCGILVCGTFPVGGNVFSGTTTIQRCTVDHCGGFDSGWNAWRAALTLCPQDCNISGLSISDIAITDSLSYAIEIVSPGSDVTNPAKGRLTNASLSRIAIDRYGLAVPIAAKEPYVDGVHGVWAREDAIGGIAVKGLTINGMAITPQTLPAADLRNDARVANGSPAFTFQLAAP